MTHTLKIALTETEMKLLLKSAALDCRRPQEQARFLLRSILFDDPRLKEDVPDPRQAHTTDPRQAKPL